MMASKESFASSHSILHQRKSDGFHPDKPSKRPSAQYESGSKLNFGAENLSIKEGRRDKPLPLIPHSAWPLHPFHFQNDKRNFPTPGRSSISADDTHTSFTDEIELQDLRQQCLSGTEAPLECYGAGNESESRPLLVTAVKYKTKGHRISSRYSEASMRTYYCKARATILGQSRRNIGSSILFSSFRMTQGIRKLFWGYDQLYHTSETRYIGEHDFWMLLKRFFGLVPLPPSLSGLFPANDEIPYIKDYLRSKPIPVEHSDGKDNDRNLVKVCTRLAEWVFRHSNSRRIFFDEDPETYSKSPNTDWEIYQGFGLIHQFCNELEYRQLDLSGFRVQTAWLQAQKMSFQKGQS
ncbi:hypothetical protein PENANT_c105G04899 [Penicillium antarcticum]|uniref:Uncharacterized protein n=1 Tax=Penicillium antarcticum TaxID=416450 RepID=A0A1V6PK93_9EURO|nr:hypothetical protein PENANT_c105G04899 [Penicillium antarcticum]